MSVEDVLERLDAMDNDPFVIFDLSESEIEEDEAVAIFPANSVRIQDNSSGSPSSSDEEYESSSESEADRREYVRKQRQDRSRKIREAISNARGRTRGTRRGQGAVRVRGRRGANRGARIQDGGHSIHLARRRHQKKLKNVYKCCGTDKTR